MVLDAGAVVGGYRIEQILGRGGMGSVYSARSVELGRQVALKVIAGGLSSDPEFVTRFRREGRLQASLEHPHVVTVFEAGETDEGLYLAMQLVPGPTLAELMREGGLDASTALSLLRQVADALDAAHAAGLVHRDVKPQNVLVGEADDAYLGDFGLTRPGGATGITVAGKLVGTISYLAPEVIRGEEAVPASDRYAFAAMAFECLTGTVPFPRKTEAAILFAHTSEPQPLASRRRPDLPEALDGVLERALSKSPGERPKSATALVDEITAALETAKATGLGPPPPPGAAALGEDTVAPVAMPAPATPAPPVRRRAAGLIAAGLVGAAIATGAIVLAGAADDDDGSGPPAILPGAQVLGSDLAEPGRTLDCNGRAQRGGSPGCTIVQSALPGHKLVVPEDGVIRRWGVRSAQGELGLAVVRERGGDTFQVTRSRNEFVGSDDPHLFGTNLAVERGDLVGLIVVPGSAAGVRETDGARTRQWDPLVNTGKPGKGSTKELLLRVEYQRGGQQRLPRQVTGAAAATLEPGRVVRRKESRFKDGRPAEIVLVSLGDRFAVDTFLEGRRSARIDVPRDFRPGDGQIGKFDAGLAAPDAEAISVYMEYTRTGSSRVLSHFLAAFPREFEFVN